VFAQVVDDTDIGMIQSGSRTRLAAKSGEMLRLKDVRASTVAFFRVGLFSICRPHFRRRRKFLSINLQALPAAQANCDSFPKSIPMI